MKAITEKTLIPLSLVMTLIGGVFWLTSIYFEAKAANSSITEIKQKQDSYTETLNSIDKRLSRIEGFLSRLGRRND